MYCTWKTCGLPCQKHEEEAWIIDGQCIEWCCNLQGLFRLNEGGASCDGGYVTEKRVESLAEEVTGNWNGQVERAERRRAVQDCERIN